MTINIAHYSYTGEDGSEHNLCSLPYNSSTDGYGGYSDPNFCKECLTRLGVANGLFERNRSLADFGNAFYQFIRPFFQTIPRNVLTGAFTNYNAERAYRVLVKIQQARLENA